MTYKQTLERIEKQKKAIDGYPVKFMFVGITEDYENVKEALEKQIPMKVIEHNGDFVCGYKAAKCKNCNHGVISFDVFCSHCGQRLEWGEEG